jgi:predicted lysophospholipase L1 biosynthesis ABC-type transport system permease subunit
VSAFRASRRSAPFFALALLRFESASLSTVHPAGVVVAFIVGRRRQLGAQRAACRRQGLRRAVARGGRHARR